MLLQWVWCKNFQKLRRKVVVHWRSSSYFEHSSHRAWSDLRSAGCHVSPKISKRCEASEKILRAMLSGWCTGPWAGGVFSLLTLEQKSLKGQIGSSKKQNLFQTLAKKTLVKKSFLVFQISSPFNFPQTNQHQLNCTLAPNQPPQRLYELPVAKVFSPTRPSGSGIASQLKRRRTRKNTRKMMETKSFESIQKRW